MRKYIILFILSLFLLPLGLQAGTKGMLKGKVTDSEGKPVTARIKLQGAPNGANVQPSGAYVVPNINPGKYTVFATMMGFDTTIVNDVVISVDDVTELNIVMKEKGVKLNTVIVTADRAMVRNSEVSRGKTFSKEQLEGTAREGIQSLVGLTAGVFSGGDGYNIRGSRNTETQMKIDGIDIANQFTGGFGIGGMNYYPMVSQLAAAEVQVITGNASAEYGEALGGTVNTVLSAGRNDRYQGAVRWRTDVGSLWGSQQHGIKIIDENNKKKVINYGTGLQLEDQGQHKFDFNISGPIPGLFKNSTFNLSSRYDYESFGSISWKWADPNGTDLGQLPNNTRQVKNITGRVSMGVTDYLKFTVGGTFGMSNFESYSSTWLYATDPGWVFDQKSMLPVLDANKQVVTNGIPENRLKQLTANQVANNAIIRVEHLFSETGSYELKATWSQNDDYIGKRVNTNAPGYFTGYDIVMPEDKYSATVGGQMALGPNKMLDQYEILKLSKSSNDGYLMIDMTQRNPLTGYIEGPQDGIGTNNPWGQAGYAQHGNDLGISLRKGSYLQLDGNYNQTFLGDFEHRLKAGFEFRMSTAHLHSNGSPWDGSPFYDIYTDLWGGNLYADNNSVFEKTSKPFEPVRGSVYLQDQIVYKRTLLITPSLRYDFFDPAAMYRTELGTFTSINSATGFAQSSIKNYISPRINVTYPLTDRSNIAIAYGIFYKMPELTYLYDGFNKFLLRGNELLGNPNMKPQRENVYEVSYSNQVTDEIMISVNPYYKDIYNQVGVSYVRAVPMPFQVYTVSEFGSARGIEFSIRKRATSADHIGIDLNYNLSAAKATAPSPGSNYNVMVDPFSEKPAYPLTESPVSWDRTHRVNFNLDLIWGNDQGPSIGNVQPLENTRWSFTTFWQTGTPYTKLDLKGQALGELNSERQPAYWRTDLRVTKLFYMRDFFGESAGNTSFEMFADIINLFDNRAVTGVYSRTNDPLDDGVMLTRKIGDFSSAEIYQKGDFSYPSSVSISQYDHFGNRLYSTQQDLDKNGIITQQERYDNYWINLQRNLQFQGNFMMPITVYFGITLKF